MRATVLLSGLLVLVATAGVVAEEAATTVVVLEGGTTLDVASALVQGGYVYLTFPDGTRQAYPTADVDLVASGLAPPEEARGEVPEQPVRPKGLAAAQSSAVQKARLEITDDDVEHVRRGFDQQGEGDGETEEEPEGAATASLLVSDLQQQLSGGNVSLSGTVHNNGAKPVSTITLEARAVDQGGATVGSGSTVIGQQLAPEGSMSFTMDFPIQGQVANIRVRASAAVADFDLEPVEPPETQAGGAAAPAEGGE